MRQIIMSKPGEFKKRDKNNHVRSVAVKMLAKLINKSEDDDSGVVIVSSKAFSQEKG